ncbi:DUF434 domain-containing protein [Verrucomicrobiota bacterium sgz303538]
MPDKRLHRGPHPEDVSGFGTEALPRLQAAVADLSWLLSRGYAERSSTKLVGDRYDLTERQRIAVRRCACSDQALNDRLSRMLPIEKSFGQRVLLDGFNVLTTVEAALGGGVVLAGRDGCCRDMASMHGSFKKVLETPDAVLLIGRTLERLGVGETIWYLDQPVSNSGRLKQLIADIAGAHQWNWRIELVPDPDTVLVKVADVVASADSGILDRCGKWLNLAREIVDEHVPDAWRISLDASGCSGDVGGGRRF